MSLRSKSLQHKHFDVSFPDDHIVVVTLNRPDKLNCVDQATSKAIAGVWQLFDQDETLLVGIITGHGRAFCTGADLGGMLDNTIDLSYLRLTRYQNGTT